MERTITCTLGSWIALCLCVGCGDSESPASTQTPPTTAASAGAGSGGGGGGGPPPAGGTSGSSSTGRAGSRSTAPAAGSGEAGASASDAGGEAGTGSAGTAGMSSMPDGGAAGDPATEPPAMVPMDGDPSKPMVSIPEIPCGVPQTPFPTVQITGRDVVVAYPCAHEGAPVTFFLFVHGTLNEPMKASFTMNAYAVHELVDSHNVIVVTPKAVGTQWGNGDGGEDLPHLHDVVNWVYDTFSTKFDIRSMWSHGGSWGARYLSTFACDPMLEERLNGVYMVVGGGCPDCSDRLSCVVIQEELEEGGGSTLSPMEQEALVDAANIAPYAMQHGCDGKMGPTMAGNVRLWDFPNCDPGWFHGFYLGPGQHADKLDQEAVIKLTDHMKMTEQ